MNEHLKANPDLAREISNEPEKEFNLLVLENLVNLTTEESLHYNNCEMIVCKDRNGSLILGDRPFLSNVIDDFNFLTLSPHILIAFRQQKDPPNYRYQDITNAGIINSYNEIVAENSRYWIVSNNKEQLTKYIKLCKEESEQDKISTLKPRALNSSYKFF